MTYSNARKLEEKPTPKKTDFQQNSNLVILYIWQEMELITSRISPKPHGADIYHQKDLIG